MIFRCAGCSLVYTDNRRAIAGASLYPPFQQTDRPAVRHAHSLLSIFLRQRAAFVRSIKPGGRLLDFGCGNGAFANWMAEQGYDVVGLEPFSLGRPTHLERLQLIREPFESVRERLGAFDVVTLWHVLEHLRNPVQILKSLAEHLNPDGVLIVSVPNFRSWQRVVFQGSWFHLDPPRHLLHFESESLAQCLQRASLSPLKTQSFLPEYGSSGWIQSVLNAFLPHANYLYEFVKDRGALNTMSRLSSFLHFAISGALAPPLLGLSLPLEAAASIADAPAALTVAAQKTAAKGAQ